MRVGVRVYARNHALMRCNILVCFRSCTQLKHLNPSSTQTCGAHVHTLHRTGPGRARVPSSAVQTAAAPEQMCGCARRFSGTINLDKTHVHYSRTHTITHELYLGRNPLIVWEKRGEKGRRVHAMMLSLSCSNV